MITYSNLYQRAPLCMSFPQFSKIWKFCKHWEWGNNNARVSCQIVNLDLSILRGNKYQHLLSLSKSWRLRKLFPLCKWHKSKKAWFPWISRQKLYQKQRRPKLSNKHNFWSMHFLEYNLLVSKGGNLSGRNDVVTTVNQYCPGDTVRFGQSSSFFCQSS